MPNPHQDPLRHAIRTEAILDVLREWLTETAVQPTPERVERALMLAETGFRSACRTRDMIDRASIAAAE